MTSASIGFDDVLRGGAHLDARVARDPAESTARLLAVAILGLAAHGALVGSLGRSLHALSAGAEWGVPLTLVAAFLGALALCLPSFFLSLRLAGYRLSGAEVAALALRIQARASALLVGTLPLIAALLLPGLAIPDWPADALVVNALLLPFAFGAGGLVSVYRSLQRSAPERGPRAPLRVVVVWGFFVAAVAPVAFARAAELLVQLQIAG